MLSRRTCRPAATMAVLVASGFFPLATARAEPSPPAPAPTTATGAGLGDARMAPTVTFTPLDPTPLAWQDGGPWDVEVHPVGQRAFVVGNDAMQKLDITRTPARVVGTTTSIVGDRMTVHPDGRLAYVINDDELDVVDIAQTRPRLVRTLRSVASAMKGIDVAPNGKVLYIAFGAGDDTTGVRVLSLADPRSPEIIAGVRTRTRITDVAVSPSGNRLITTHGRTQRRATFIDVTNRREPRLLSTVGLSFAAGRVQFSPDGQKAYVLGDPIHGEAKIARLDVSSRRLGQVRHLVDDFKGGGGLDVSPTGNYVYLVLNTAVTGAPSVIFLKARDLTAVAAFSVRGPTALTVSPAGRTRGRIYLTSRALPGDEVPPIFFPIRPS